MHAVKGALGNGERQLRLHSSSSSGVAGGGGVLLLLILWPWLGPSQESTLQEMCDYNLGWGLNLGPALDAAEHCHSDLVDQINTVDRQGSSMLLIHTSWKWGLPGCWSGSCN